MHCFESALMRDYLFGLVRELDPVAARDDLMLDEVLDDNGVTCMSQLLELGTEHIIDVVRRLARELPIAA